MREAPLNLSDPLLSIRSVATYLDMSSRQVHRLRRSGILRGTKLRSPRSNSVSDQSPWRIFSSSVQRYVRAHGGGGRKAKPTRDRDEIERLYQSAMAKLGLKPTPARVSSAHGRSAG